MAAALIGSSAAALAAWMTISEPMAARATVIAAICICLWLSEAVPPFVPTLILLVAVPLFLSSYGPQHELAPVLAWLADPVLALFFGGFVLGGAIARHGLDRAIAGLTIHWSQGSNLRLLSMVMVTTAFLSLWMSNIAATAMMIAALRPLLDASDERLRRAWLIGVAMAANLGGMGSPLGSGPNAIALSMAEGQISFLTWMLIGLPIAALSIGVAGMMIVRRFRVTGRIVAPQVATERISPSGWRVLMLMVIAVAAWLTGPLHGVSAPLVSLALAALLFASGLLDGSDFKALDWSTLALIGGGIALGRLIDHTGLIGAITASFGGDLTHTNGSLVILVILAATMSAVMSNTAAATLLIPIGVAMGPLGSTNAMVIALACSFGLPFVISTPQNAMAVGSGARSSDLLWIGVPLMIGGCVALLLLRPLIAALLG